MTLPLKPGSGGSFNAVAALSDWPLYEKAENGTLNKDKLSACIIEDSDARRY